eukprot:scaffold116104_cov36-Prasinocladus_malaysianus.AAC.1
MSGKGCHFQRICKVPGVSYCLHQSGAVIPGIGKYEEVPSLHGLSHAFYYATPQTGGMIGLTERCSACLAADATPGGREPGGGGVHLSAQHQQEEQQDDESEDRSAQGAPHHRPRAALP